MDVILFDTTSRKKLFPLTLTRALADVRAGILSIREYWELQLKAKVFVLTEQYLAHLYEPVPAGEYLLIDSSVYTSQHLVDRITQLQTGQAITDNNGLVAGRAAITELPAFGSSILHLFNDVQPVPDIERLNSPCEFFQNNEHLIREHFELVTRSRVTQPIPETVQVVKPGNIFIEEGAQLSFCILNALNGPIYIGKDAVIMEGSIIRGPFAMGEGAVLKMGSKMYPGTSLGPYSTGGGEIKNSILMGYSNKAHDGYLGDSVIGEWCNLGAGTSNSNVKNTATEVKVWNYYSHEYLPSGIKCGLIMGDYSRTAINTAINTGTVIGICCNVFGEGLTPKVIPDFTWGTKGLTLYEFDKAVRDIMNWKQMKQRTLDEQKVKVLRHIFEHYND